jgi:peptide-methionine (R)-S-oxide reductase
MAATPSPAGDRASTTAPTIVKSDDEWRAELDPAAYAVLRHAATERPFTGEYTDETAEGVYLCRACGAELFRSTTKFASHCGWPSFYAPSVDDNVTLHRDATLGMERVEVRCSTCGSHLGHVFEGEGYPTPTDQRYCINSVALKLVKTEGADRPL